MSDSWVFDKHKLFDVFTRERMFDTSLRLAECDVIVRYHEAAIFSVEPSISDKTSVLDLRNRADDLVESASWIHGFATLSRRFAGEHRGES